MTAARLLTALAMVAGLAVAGARGTAAQSEDGVFTAESYDWSLEFDDGDWEVTGEDSFAGYDGIALRSDVAFVIIDGLEDFDGDPELCTDAVEAGIEDRDGVSDVEESDEFDLPDSPRGAEAVVYTYTQEFDDGDTGDIVEYVECRELVEGEAVLRLTLQTIVPIYPDALEAFEELIEGLEVDETGSSRADDDEAAEDEDADAEETREVTLDEEDDDDVVTEDDDEATDEDDEDADADSGIDGDSYESPTYGFSVEWDEDVWEANPDGELVDHDDATYEALDRLTLRSVDGIGTFYLEGHTAYDGDLDDCLEAEADLLGGNNEEFDVAEDGGEPITGETDDDGVFGVYEGVVLDEDDEEFDLVYYIECRELVEGEAVLVITFITATTADFNDNFDDFVTPVIETIDIPGAAGDDDEPIDAEDAEDTEDDEEVREDEDDEAEAEAEEVEDTSGVDGSTYESPTYGYLLEWDDTVWEADDASTRRGVDTLVLASDFGLATFTATDEYDGDPADCYADLEADIEDEIDDPVIAEGEDGEIRESSSTEEFGLYLGTADGEAAFAFVACQAYDDVTVSAVFIGPVETGEEGLDEFADLLDAVEEP